MNAGGVCGPAGPERYTDPALHALASPRARAAPPARWNFRPPSPTPPDPVANDRAIAWNYSAAQALRHPLIDRYYFTNTATIGGTSYENKNLFTNPGGLFGCLPRERPLRLETDLQHGLPCRGGPDPRSTNNWAHNFTFEGGNGNLIPNVAAHHDLGYAYDQSQTQHRKDQDFQSFTGDGNLVWHFSRALSFSGNASKAFGHLLDRRDHQHDHGGHQGQRQAMEQALQDRTSGSTASGPPSSARTAWAAGTRSSRLHGRSRHRDHDPPAPESQLYLHGELLQPFRAGSSSARSITLTLIATLLDHDAPFFTFVRARRTPLGRRAGTPGPRWRGRMRPPRRRPPAGRRSYTLTITDRIHLEVVGESDLTAASQRIATATGTSTWSLRAWARSTWPA